MGNNTFLNIAVFAGFVIIVCALIFGIAYENSRPVTIKVSGELSEPYFIENLNLTVPSGSFEFEVTAPMGFYEADLMEGFD